MTEALSTRLRSLAHFSFTWRDAVDIVIVALVVYFLLRLIRGTRAVQMVFGLIAVLVVYWISVVLKLVALRTVLTALIFYLPFAIIVLFASELRRALAGGLPSSLSSPAITRRRPFPISYSRRPLSRPGGPAR